jgi:large subunit ribosomal protein L15
MSQLHTLQNETSVRKVVQRIGRGPGSGRGKTSCRGHKGAGSRSGYKRRLGKEGGRMPLYMKLPTKGFTRGRFCIKPFVISLSFIEQYFQDGEVVNLKSLLEKGFISKNFRGLLRVLSNGALTKKLTIEANKFSQATLDKLDKSAASYKIV